MTGYLSRVLSSTGMEVGTPQLPPPAPGVSQLSEMTQFAESEVSQVGPSASSAIPSTTGMEEMMMAPAPGVPVLRVPPVTVASAREELTASPAEVPLLRRARDEGTSKDVTLDAVLRWVSVGSIPIAQAASDPEAGSHLATGNEAASKPEAASNLVIGDSDVNVVPSGAPQERPEPETPRTTGAVPETPSVSIGSIHVEIEALPPSPRRQPLAMNAPARAQTNALLKLRRHYVLPH